MKLKYGYTNTYDHELDAKRLKWLTDKTNRSLPQTQFLFNLVDGDFKLLKKLETQLKNCLISYVPGDKKELNNVLKMKPVSDRFKL